MASKNQARDDLIQRQYDSGMSLGEVGDLHGLTRERVRQILKARGVEIRKPGRKGDVAAALPGNPSSPEGPAVPAGVDVVGTLPGSPGPAAEPAGMGGPDGQPAGQVSS